MIRKGIDSEILSEIEIQKIAFKQTSFIKELLYKGTG